MQKNSFVFHFDYLSDLPEELKGVWALLIIDYAENGKEPTFTNWYELKAWNHIKKQMDDDAEKYEKKLQNLRQNTRNSSKVYTFTDNETPNTDTTESTPNRHRIDTESEKKTPNRYRVDNLKTTSVGVNVNVNDNVNVNEYVNVNVTSDTDETNQPTNQPTFTNINNTFAVLGYPIDEKTYNNISKSFEANNLELSPAAIEYAFNIVSSKTYGKGSDKAGFYDKTEEVQKKLFISALLKYPKDIYTDYEAWKKKQAEEKRRAKNKQDEAAARSSPPSKCKCGAELSPKGSGLICYDCRRTYEIIKNKWVVNE